MMEVTRNIVKTEIMKCVGKLCTKIKCFIRQSNFFKLIYMFSESTGKFSIDLIVHAY